MTGEPEISLGTPTSENGLPGLEPLRHRVDGRRASPAANRTEAQLRARVTELELQLGEIAHCLEDAENRAAEVIALREEVIALHERLLTALAAERELAVIVRTRSWRYTTPARTVGKHVRRQLGH